MGTSDILERLRKKRRATIGNYSAYYDHKALGDDTNNNNDNGGGAAAAVCGFPEIEIGEYYRTDAKVRQLLKRNGVTDDGLLLYFSMIGGENPSSHHRSAWWKMIKVHMQICDEADLDYYNPIECVKRQLRIFDIRSKDARNAEKKLRRQERKRQKRQKRQRNCRRY
jgi:hypothetical protein